MAHHVSPELEMCGPNFECIASQRAIGSSLPVASVILAVRQVTQARAVTRGTVVRPYCAAPTLRLVSKTLSPLITSGRRAGKTGTSSTTTAWTSRWTPAASSAALTTR